MRQYVRIRVRNPKLFKKNSFRTHDIGREGHSKRIAGKLKVGGWATQSYLISLSDVVIKNGKIIAKDPITRKLLESIRKTYGGIIKKPGGKYEFKTRYSVRKSSLKKKRKRKR
ncbi:MAG: hypothetical protein ACTSPL_03985 [Candidatus Odinarchaeia archaeon]